MRVLFLAILTSFSLTSFAAATSDAKDKAPAPPAKVTPKYIKVVHFVPGKYALASGDANLCGDGAMGPNADGQTFAFGDLHGFELTTQNVEMPGDAPGDEDCVYKVQDTVETKADVTVLRFVEERFCKGQLKHTLTETGYVSKDQLRLEAVQSGEDPADYSCAWAIRPHKKQK